MRSVKNKGLQALLAATVAAVIAAPIAIAGAGGPVASGSAKSRTAKQVRLLKQQTARMARLASLLSRQVIVLEERLAAIESVEIPAFLPPRGPAGGDLVGTFPNPQLAPNTIGSLELANGSVQSGDIADGTIKELDIASGGVGTLQIADGGVAGPDLKGAEFRKNFNGRIVNPGTTVIAKVSCAEGDRLLSGGHEWLNTAANGLSIISSGPDLDDPNRTWSVQARVDSGGSNTIFAIALCIKG